MTYEDKLNEIVKRQHDTLMDDYKKVAAKPEGRRLLYRVLEQAKVFQDTYTGENTGTIYNAGMRAIGLKVLNEMLEADKTILSRAQAEYESQKGRENKELEKAKEMLDNEIP